MASDTTRTTSNLQEQLKVGYGPSAQSLCHLCASIDCATINSLQEDKAEYIVEHHQSFEDLQSSATNGCSLCQLFHQEIESYRGTKSNWFDMGPMKLKFWTTAVGTMTRLREDYEGGSVLKLRVSYLASTMRRGSLDFHISRTEDEFNRILSPFPDLELCAGWVNRCSEQYRSDGEDHSRCLARQETALPSRVISVGALHEDSVRLVETKSEKGTYACLSHCWGVAPMKLRTLLSNMEQHKERIPLVSLPQTFKDSITVCRTLGVPFIWIDSLCIIQDDPKDWERECVKMCSIYQDSAFTIAASWGDESDSGFLHFRQQHQCSPCLIPGQPGYIISPLGRAIPGSKPGVNTKSVAGSWLSTLELPPTGLLTRSWVLQERLLSPRVLYFHQDELYFDCFAGRFREAYPHLAHQIQAAQSYESSTFERAIFQGRDSIVDRAQLTQVWLSVVQEYSRTELSYQNDLLPALSGVARGLTRLSVKMGESLQKYAAGVWLHEDCWSQCLAWHAALKARQYRVNTTDSLPSWSWASCSQAIDFFIQDWIVEEVDIKVKKCDVQPSGLDPYGTVQSGAALHVAGYLQAYMIRPAKVWRSGSSPWKRNSEKHQSIWTVDGGQELTAFVPDQLDLHEREPVKEVMCLSLCIDAHQWWYGIVLDKLSATNYRRIGICYVDRIGGSDKKATDPGWSPEEVRLRMNMWKAGSWEEFVFV